MQSKFHVTNVTAPSDADLKKIFSTLINQKFADFEEEIKPLGEIITKMIIAVYTVASNELLPTPSKPVYLFNMRDMCKVVQGVLQSHRDFYDTRDTMLRE